jgi:hypothetical protein
MRVGPETENRFRNWAIAGICFPTCAEPLKFEKVISNLTLEFQPGLH